MLLVNDLAKQFGDQLLFEDLNFSINSGDRLGLVGRNGHGKTTLFKMIAGLESIDEGVIQSPKDYKIGYLSQNIDFQEDTVIKEGCRALPEDESEGRWRVEKVLSGLGFQTSDFERSPSEFSGGYQMRLNLAKTLVAQPDLLMLDEPTNFLDIVAIRWLVLFLKKWPGEILLISHDRIFMDSVVTQVMGIHRRRVLKIPGRTENYYAKILMDEESHEKSRVNFEKKKKLAKEYIDKYRAKARRASQIQSRIKALDRMGSIEKLRRVKDLYFKFNEAPIPPKYCLEARNLKFSYEEEGPLLVEDFSITILNTDRIGIIGKNGKGKTTLMNLLAGRLTPTSGYVRQHPQCQMAHFIQANMAELNNNMTVLEEILASREDGDNALARRVCGAMMFSGQMALKNISMLSGGEKCRVLLGKLLGQSSNTLLLDEPTHHLDMQSCQAMIDSITDFSGAAVVVTHDEHFLKEVANRLIVFQNEKITLFEGDYETFLKEVGWEEAEGEGLCDKDKSDKMSKKEQRQYRAEYHRKKKSVLGPTEQKIKSLEESIEAKENLMIEKNQEMIEVAEKQEKSKIQKVAKELGLLNKKVTDMYEDLDEVLEQLESLTQQFESENVKLY
jgi:ATP-binding cassette subfamily F protein 3